jgi:hypothetical protein
MWMRRSPDSRRGKNGYIENDGRGVAVVRGGKKTYQFFIVTSFFLGVEIIVPYLSRRTLILNATASF